MATPVSTVITYDSDVPAHVSALAALVSAGAVNNGVGIADGAIYHAEGIIYGATTYAPYGIFSGDSFQTEGILIGDQIFSWCGSGIYADGGSSYYGSGIWDGSTYYPWTGAGIYGSDACNYGNGIFDGGGIYATGIFDGNTYYGSGIWDGGAYGGWYGAGIYDADFQSYPTGVHDGVRHYDEGMFTEGARTAVGDWIPSTSWFPSPENVSTVETTYGPDGSMAGTLDMALYALWQGAGIYTDQSTYNPIGMWVGGNFADYGISADDGYHSFGVLSPENVFLGTSAASESSHTFA